VVIGLPGPALSYGVSALCGGDGTGGYNNNLFLFQVTDGRGIRPVGFPLY